MLSLAKRRKTAIAKARKVHSDRYDYSRVNFKSQHEKTAIICPVHGVFFQRFHSHLVGYGCSECGKTQMALTKRSDPEILRLKFIKRAREVHGNKYDYSKVDYTDKGVGDKVIIVDKTLGEFEQTYGNHVNLKHKHPKHYTLVANHQIKIDAMHGTVGQRRLRFFLSSKKIHNNCYSYPYLKKEFKGFTSSITVLCPKCGPVKQIAHNHMKGHGCRFCKRSFYEKQLTDWLRVVLPKSSVVLCNDRKILDGKELDIYLPDYKLAIEIGGVYWHSDSKLDRNYHVEKHKKCEESGVSLITLFDNEWRNGLKRAIIKQRILAKLGLLTTKLDARKCDILEVKTSKAKKFLMKNHLAGYSPSSVNLGLFFEDKLVSLIALGRSRFNKNYEWEIIRFCNHRKSIVRGSFSRLFSAFVKTYLPTSVINYSDLRWGYGNVATYSGFTFLRKTAPAAWYTHLGGHRLFYHRMKMQKHRLHKILATFDPARSAAWNLANCNWVTVYDCGNAVYEWRAK